MASSRLALLVVVVVYIIKQLLLIVYNIVQITLLECDNITGLHTKCLRLYSFYIYTLKSHIDSPLKQSFNEAVFHAGNGGMLS